ncbi:MAG: UDP-N-acetylmuramoyl-tripeptide--D-alanyl-D-alanine ligase [Pseudomonadota bacterium]
MAASWGEITVREILIPTEGILVSGEGQVRLKGLSTDSRKIKPGELFLALKGERFDGHDFIGQALRLDAAGAMVEKGWWERQERQKEIRKSLLPRQVVIAVEDTLGALGDLAGWWRHQHKARVVAVTGSAGKTTTKEMTAKVLGLGGRTLKNPGNLNNLIGLPLTLMQLEEGHKNAVLEMGMNRPGEISRLSEITDPDVGVITNVGMAHLEGLGDLEGVARAKVELVEKISPEGMVVINGDDELLLRTAAPYQKELVTFGIGRKNTLWAGRIQNLGREGVSFDLHYQGESCAVILKVPGLQNVSNALAAAGASVCLKEPMEHIAKGLGEFSGIKGRFMVNSLPGGIILIDDTYNANPMSLEATLGSVETMAEGGGRIIVGLGEMLELGGAAASAHYDAGRKVAQHGAYRLLAMGEHGPEMIAGAIDYGMTLGQAEEVKSHAEMAGKIREDMREGDLVLLKGSRRMALERVVEELMPALAEII